MRIQAIMMDDLGNGLANRYRNADLRVRGEREAKDEGIEAAPPSPADRHGEGPARPDFEKQERDAINRESFGGDARSPVVAKGRGGGPMRLIAWHRRSSIPGFGLGMGILLTALSLIVLIPLAALMVKAGGLGWSGFWSAATGARAMAAYRLSFGAAAIAALINLPFGLLVAWVLVRIDFPGRRLVDAVVDLPFALPTAVAGISLTALYASNGLIGSLLEPLGIKIAYTAAGVTLALVFIGLPFIVRTVEPVLAEVGRDVEEAAASLGAGRITTFRKVILPAIAPALATGFALAFARGVGEYGSVIFIAGNMPYHTEIAPLLIVVQLEQFDYGAATAIACVILAVSFLALLAINLVQGWAQRRMIAR
jgi:sulfate transport system permease protein